MATVTDSSAGASVSVESKAVVKGRQTLLPYGTPFDQNGLFYYIGSQEKSSTYVNPNLLENNRVVVTTSSVVDEDVSEAHRFVHHDAQEPNGTDDIPNSWMQVVTHSQLLSSTATIYMY